LRRPALLAILLFLGQLWLPLLGWPPALAQELPSEPVVEHHHRLGLGVGYPLFGAGGTSRSEDEASSEDALFGTEFRGPSIYLSIERDLADRVALGAFIKAQWPDVSCSYAGDCGRGFYFTPDSGVILAVVPRVAFRLSGSVSEVSVLLGVGAGLSGAVSGKGSDTSLALGIFGQLDLSIAIPLPSHWGLELRFASNAQYMEPVSGPIEAKLFLFQFLEVSLGATYTF
jgi:hypothetical protein